MQPILWIIISTLAISLLGFIGVFSLWVSKKTLDKFLHVLVSFSAGALLGGAFFHLLAESIEMGTPTKIFGFTLIGFVLFLLIEGFFHSHLCESCHAHPFTYTMLFGDAVHNFIDGLVIAAAYLTSIPIGLVTTIMIIGHETPQELGLFGSLVYGGHKKKNALWYSYIAQSTVIVGGVIGFFTVSHLAKLNVFLLPFAAGGFIYIAAADLVPEMHKMYGDKLKNSAKVLFSFALGITFMIALKVLFK